MKKDGASKEWLRLPVAAMQDKDLTQSDLYVLAYLLDRVDGEKKAVSIKSIAEKTELSERQVKRCIKQLIENKYIKAERRTGATTLYYQCDVLDPKRQPKPKKEQAKKSSNYDDFDVEEYKEFINDFGTDFYTGKYAKYKEG